MLGARHTSTVCARVRVAMARIRAHEGSDTRMLKTHAQTTRSMARMRGNGEGPQQGFGPREILACQEKIAGGEGWPDGPRSRSNCSCQKKAKVTPQNNAVQEERTDPSVVAKSPFTSGFAADSCNSCQPVKHAGSETPRQNRKATPTCK